MLITPVTISASLAGRDSLAKAKLSEHKGMNRLIVERTSR
jgi:hypothetical protein